MLDLGLPQLALWLFRKHTAVHYGPRKMPLLYIMERKAWWLFFNQAAKVEHWVLLGLQTVLAGKTVKNKNKDHHLSGTQKTRRTNHGTGSDSKKKKKKPNMIWDFKNKRHNTWSPSKTTLKKEYERQILKEKKKEKHLKHLKQLKQLKHLKHLEVLEETSETRIRYIMSKEKTKKKQIQEKRRAFGIWKHLEKQKEQHLGFQFGSLKNLKEQHLGFQRGPPP